MNSVNQKLIHDKMAETLRKASELQNYAIENYELLEKLAKLHDHSSHIGFHANKYFEDKMLQTEFDDDAAFQEIQDEFVKSLALLYNISEKKALIDLQQLIEQPTESEEK